MPVPVFSVSIGADLISGRAVDSVLLLDQTRAFTPVGFKDFHGKSFRDITDRVGAIAFYFCNEADAPLLRLVHSGCVATEHDMHSFLDGFEDNGHHDYSFGLIRG